MVGAPVGDVEDITHRALRILRDVVLVVADDVDHARRLLADHDIATPLTATDSLDAPLSALETDDIALFSTGWSPGPSGPGQLLIHAAIERDFPVVPIPGPTLPVTALVISGLPADSFVYLGELPQGPAARRGLLASVASERRARRLRSRTTVVAP